MEIAPIASYDSIPKDQACQEASPMSGHRYFACGGPAIAIVDNGDSRPYYMCASCTYHNLKNRGASVIFSTDKVMKQAMLDGAVKVKKVPRPPFVETGALGQEGITDDDLPKGDE